MSEITRRSVLTGAAAAGVLVAGSWNTNGRHAIAARGNQIPVSFEEHRVVVIGSGFGGGVSALRLAQAGVPVTVLERGMRWPTGPNSETFPRASAPDKRLLWYRSNPNLFGTPLLFEPYTGLIEAVADTNMTVLCASGVGGGSLVYQGMSLQPTEEVFNAHFPGNELDWGVLDRVHYPRVARMLGLAVAPDELVEHPNYLAARVFADNVRKAGLPLDKIPMPIDWNYALAELRGEMKPSFTNGDGAMGVNNGGKNSVDVTYIAAAEATGLVTVQTLHEVTDVERAADGRWTIYVNRLDTTGAVQEQKIITAGSLIMAAGSVNTTKLLVRASATGRIPDLPDALGEGWGTNADRIYVWNNPGANFGKAQGGPVVYGSKNWEDPEGACTLVQASIPPLQIDPMSTMMVGYGVSRSRGRFDYDAGAQEAKLSWPADGDAAIQNNRIGPLAHRIAGPDTTLIDTNALFPSTWHPLGGACMGTVCDVNGRVHGQRGLYVLDGALMPGNTAACNPSMTIAAIAEHALDNLVANDVGTVI